MHDTVLVVDDERHVRTALRMMLHLEGYSVAEAADGRAALQRAHAAPPAVVLLDLRLPGLDGAQCCQALHATLPQVPVVLMTAAYRAPAAAAACGAAGCLAKPFDLDTVLDVVSRFVPAPHP
jgi:two-component system, OmpR family, response regulator MprA